MSQSAGGHWMSSSFLLLFGAGLLCGSINSISLKICYQTQVVGIDGRTENFTKPWFFSCVMFLACLVALPIYYAQLGIAALRRRARAAKTSGSAFLVEASTKLVPDAGVSGAIAGVPDFSATPNEQQHDPVTPKLFFLLFVPSICDLLGTSMQQMGLCVTTVSVFQMLKGSILLFSAFLSVWFLDKQLTAYNWAGIGLCLVGISTVGAASVLSAGDSSEGDAAAFGGADDAGANGVAFIQEKAEAGGTGLPGQAFLGIGCILFGQVICSAQYVIEEHLLRPPHNVTPMAIVGLEGFWGSAVMISLVLPLCARLPGQGAYNEYENTDDSVAVLFDNRLLLVLTSIFFVSVLLYNVIGVTVTAESSAIHHTFLDASRTLVIWVVSVFLYYVVDPSYGEPLTAYSPLQAIGFLILVAGQLAYEGVVRIPGINYDELDRLQNSSYKFASPALAAYASPRVFGASPADRWNTLASPRSVGAATPQKLGSTP